MVEMMFGWKTTLHLGWFDILNDLFVFGGSMRPAKRGPVYYQCCPQHVSPLNDKRKILPNAIDLAHAPRNAPPRAAILSAAATVSQEIRSTVFEAALCKTAQRGEITGAILDDVEVGNMRARRLEYLAEAQFAGTVLGACVPNFLTRLAACAIALLLAHHEGIAAKWTP